MSIRNTKVQFYLLAFVLSAAAASTLGQSQRKVTQLADGVYEIQHEPNGNTTVIIGERQVFVVDTCFLPSAAREDIAQIRKWTDKPVSFVLNTHFHNDHNFGNRAYMDAFPALTIISHVETKKDMDLFGPGSLSREESGTAYYQRMLDSGRADDGKPLTDAGRTELRKTLDHRKQVQDEMRKAAFQSAT